MLSSFCVKQLTIQPTIKPQIRMKTDQNLQERCVLVPPSQLRVWSALVVRIRTRTRIRTTGPDGEEEQHCEPAPCVCWCYLGELGHRGRFPLMNYREPPLTRRYFTCPLAWQAASRRPAQRARCLMAKLGRLLLIAYWIMKVTQLIKDFNTVDYL